MVNMLVHARGTNGRISRRDFAYQEVCNRLLSGEWRPGEIISTYTLAEDLGVSRTPVVEAVKRLEAEGILEIVPQVGCVVRGPEPEEVRETFLIRAVLEGLSAEVAAEKISQEDVEALGKILEASREAGEDKDGSKYAELNRAFHNHIARISGLRTLEQTLISLWQLNSYQIASIPFFEVRFEDSLAEHLTILERLRDRDAKGAREVTEIHLRRCAEEFATFLENPERKSDSTTSTA